jgi:Fur family iron response transcriptional regulator
MNNLDKYIKKLRESGLRPTKQRLKICDALFTPEKTFHFTVKDLVKIIEEKSNIKISVATVYNTVSAFKKKGYLKEISITSEKSYFDTNINNHHHFFDVKENELIDIEANQVELKNIPSPPDGKTIKNVNVVINVENDSQ